MKKQVIALLLSLSLITGAALKPSRSEAGLVGFFGSASLGVERAFCATWVGMLGADAVMRSSSFKDTLLTILFITGAVLDDSANQKIVLNTIGNRLALDAGLSSEEQESYNSNLDVIQAALDDISAQVASLDEADRVPQARKLWKEYSTVIAPSAFSAQQKLAAYIASQEN